MTKPFVFLWRETMKFGWVNNLLMLLWLPWVVVFMSGAGTGHRWLDVLLSVGVMLVCWGSMDSAYIRGRRSMIRELNEIIENNSAQRLDTA